MRQTQLQSIAIPPTVDQVVLPSAVDELIHSSLARIETFQDCWERKPIEQFVAADYRLVCQTLMWTLESQARLGQRFLEWGCGFAVVSAVAAMLDLDAIGIEADAELCAQGRRTLSECRSTAELIRGNFLPAGAERLAEDPTVPSLGHDVRSGYEQLGLDLDDFAIVYAYPWPGEDDFHEQVFLRHAAVGALLMLFCGPYDVRRLRKVETSR